MSEFDDDDDTTRLAKPPSNAEIPQAIVALRLNQRDLLRTNKILIRLGYAMLGAAGTLLVAFVGGVWYLAEKMTTISYHDVRIERLEHRVYGPSASYTSHGVEGSTLTDGR